MSRAAALRLAVLAVLGTSIAVLVRTLRGDPAPIFAAPAAHRGVLAPAVTRPAEPPTGATTDPASKPVEPSPPGKRWAFPVDGECPPSHPIKAKLRSGIFHLPGMMAYDRARPDRCYATEADAEADGLRRAKR